MNKNQEIILRRKVVQLSATFFALVLVLSACKKEVTEIGSGLQDGNLELTTVDTFSIITYSEDIDSLRSDERAINLLGAYNDPVFGGVNCGIVTQIAPEAYTQSFPDLANIVMDSVVLSLRYGTINYYANLADISVEVFEIGDDLVRDDQSYYTFDDPTIVGDNLALTDPLVLSPDVVAEPVVGTDTLAPQLRIHLKPEVGVDLVADSHAGLMGEANWFSTFKGLYVRVAVDEDAAGFGLPEGHGTVLYFALENALSKMTIYYHDLTGVYGDFDFQINSNCARYSRIRYEREGKPLANLLENKELGKETFYVQGTVVNGVIEFPFIEDFYKNEAGEIDPKIINKVELVLPIQDFGIDPFDPAIDLYMLKVYEDGTFGCVKDYWPGADDRPCITEKYNESEKAYRLTYTQEIQAVLNGDFKVDKYLVAFSGFYGSSVERIIFNGSETSLKDKPRLEITYTEY